MYSSRHNDVIARYAEEGKRTKIKMATEILIINYFRAGRFYLKRNSRQTSRHGTNTNVQAVSTHKVILLIFCKYRPPHLPLL